MTEECALEFKIGFYNPFMIEFEGKEFREIREFREYKESPP